MKVYIQTDKNGDYYNVNAFVAAMGFKSLGFEVFKYVDVQEITNTERDSVFVGGIGTFRKRLEYLGIEIPKEIEYPSELSDFLNRKIWLSTLKEIISEEKSGIFIKPVEAKLFPGRVITEFKDFIGLNYKEDVQVWCSELINPLTEWRCFVRYRKLLDVRYYKGAWDSKLNLDIVNDAISKYSNQPVAYSLDFGVDSSGKYYLIEVNDGHSLGCYGMGAVSYAKLLSARWSEITETRDMLNF